ncbi:MAG: hypothetical protein QXI39_09535 [Candidatus Bathyarchaeia archaeon]
MPIRREYCAIDVPLLINTTQLAPPGGLFLTRERPGSLGVTTINLPRIGFLAKDDATISMHEKRKYGTCQSSI